MKYILLTFILTLGAGQLFAEQNELLQEDATNSKDKVLKWLAQREYCGAFINNNVYSDTTRCFELIVYERDFNRKYLDEFFTRKFKELNLPTEILTKLLQITLQNNTDLNGVISFLINSGASTKDIDISSIANIYDDTDCKATLYIIKSREKFYKSGEISIFRDFSYLTAPGYHESRCPRALKELIRYDKAILNIQDEKGYTGLHNSFTPYAFRLLPSKLSMELMTQTNVNLQTLEGDTPLHILLGEGTLMYKGDDIIKSYLSVVKEYIRLGGSIMLKNNKGITVHELLSKHMILRKALI